VGSGRSRSASMWPTVPAGQRIRPRPASARTSASSRAARPPAAP
jgi:hypothetical protein